MSDVRLLTRHVCACFMIMQRVFLRACAPTVDPYAAPRPRAAGSSYSLDKLVATIHTVLIPCPSFPCMFLFATLSDRDTRIHHLATHGAAMYRNVASAVIVVGAPVCLWDHHSLLFSLQITDSQETPQCDPAGPSHETRSSSTWSFCSQGEAPGVNRETTSSCLKALCQLTASWVASFVKKPPAKWYPRRRQSRQDRVHA